MKKYDWLAGDSGPKNFPMKIVRGHFTYPNDESSLYIPNMAKLDGGWGNPRSTHVVGPKLKPLPNRISITYFSYTENKFYKGEFDLPYQYILSLFEKGYYSPKTKGQQTYNEIVTGVAPGGAVAVWLFGIDRRTEVFFGHAKEEDLPWEEFLDNPDIEREDFARKGVEASVEPLALKKLDAEGIPYGLWDRYHIRYNWQLDINAENSPGLVELISYYNGEEGYLLHPDENPDDNHYRAIPVHLDYIWITPEGQGFGVQYHFDEDEIFKAFKHLAPGDGKVIEIPLRLETRIEKQEQGYHASVWLHNQTESIHLEKTRVVTAATSRRVE